MTYMIWLSVRSWIVGSLQLLQSLEFHHLYNSLIVKVSNVRRVAYDLTKLAKT